MILENNKTEASRINLQTSREIPINKVMSWKHEKMVKQRTNERMQNDSRKGFV